MNTITIHEVVLRDGLQNEQQLVSLNLRQRWLEAILATGIDLVQVGSFVNPTKVPQMALTDDLCRWVVAKGLSNRVTALVLNEKGYDRGSACGITYFCCGVSASETHSRRNTGRSIAEAIQGVVALAKRALKDGMTVQASVQSAFGCSFEGEIDRQKVLDLVAGYIDCGIRRISLADTAGRATPDRVEELFGRIATFSPEIELACHFHESFGLGLANCYAAYKTGVRLFEAALAGLGGCPFTENPSGNVASEDLVHLMQRMNKCQTIDLDRLIGIADSVSANFRRENASKVSKLDRDEIKPFQQGRS